jgi:hypothetical protein
MLNADNKEFHSSAYAWLTPYSAPYTVCHMEGIIMYDTKMLHRMLSALNTNTSKGCMLLGAVIAAMEWMVGGSFVSGALLALRLDLKLVVLLQVSLLILGLTAKSRNSTTSRLSYGDAVNITRWLSATFIGTIATMLGLAPVAFLCYVCTASSCALYSAIGALYVGGTMLLAWYGIVGVQDLATEKYQLYRLQRLAS